MANGNGRDLIDWSVTDCEQAALIREGALRVVYDSHINRTGSMTIQQVLQFKAAEKAAKDAFWAAAGAAGSKMTSKQVKLQAAMIAATKARQAAMTAYAAAL